MTLKLTKEALAVTKKKCKLNSFSRQINDYHLVNMIETFFALFSHPELLKKAFLLSIPISFMLFCWMFPSCDHALEALRYLFQPGWLSLLRGEFVEDLWESIKIYIFLVLWAAIVTGIYKFLISSA